jgi:hypothetical protein
MGLTQTQTTLQSVCGRVLGLILGQDVGPRFAVVGPTLAKMEGIFPLAGAATIPAASASIHDSWSFIARSWVIISGNNNGLLHCKSSIF